MPGLPPILRDILIQPWHRARCQPRRGPQTRICDLQPRTSAPKCGCDGHVAYGQTECRCKGMRLTVMDGQVGTVGYPLTWGLQAEVSAQNPLHPWYGEPIGASTRRWCKRTAGCPSLEVEVDPRFGTQAPERILGVPWRHHLATMTGQWERRMSEGHSPGGSASPFDAFVLLQSETWMSAQMQRDGYLDGKVHRHPSP